MIPQNRELSGPGGDPIQRREIREYSSEALYKILEGGEEKTSPCVSARELPVLGADDHDQSQSYEKMLNRQ